MRIYQNRNDSKATTSKGYGVVERQSECMDASTIRSASRCAAVNVVHLYLTDRSPLLLLLSCMSIVNLFVSIEFKVTVLSLVLI